MGTTKGNAPLKQLTVPDWAKAKKHNPEPYEAHMVLLAQEYKALPESIKAMVNECPLCYGEGTAYFTHPVYNTLETKPCPNQCYLVKAS